MIYTGKTYTEAAAWAAQDADNWSAREQEALAEIALSKHGRDYSLNRGRVFEAEGIAFYFYQAGDNSINISRA